MDLITAFLCGTLDEHVNTRQPESFAKENLEDTVCHLDGSIYGLKQVPREWNKDIDAFFCGELEMTRNTTDLCLYVRHTSSSLMIIPLYVNELLTASNADTVLVEMKQA